MEIVENSACVYEKIKDERFFIEDGHFYKSYSPSDDDINSLILIEKNRNKLTQYFYSMVLKIHKYQGKIIAFESTYHDDYDTLENTLKSKKFDKRKMFLEIVQVLEELKSIGVDYWDLHSKNILIKNHVKFVDLSGAISNPKQQDFSFHYYRLLEILLEMYLFFDYDSSIGCTDFLLRDPLVSKYFSYEHLIWMQKTNRSDFTPIDWEDFLKEFEDEEKITILRQRLRKNIWSKN